MYLSINKVKPLKDYKLELTFANDEIRIFDVKPYLDTGLLTNGARSRPNLRFAACAGMIERVRKRMRTKGT